MYMTLSRGRIETQLETDLVEIAKTMIPADPTRDDLQQALDRDPLWFGGIFPTMGIQAEISRGTSKYQDKPARPSRVDVTIYIYEPCMPVRGPSSFDDDSISVAKKRTRSIRDAFLEKVLNHHNLGPACQVDESRGFSSDDMGTARTNDQQNEILWCDRTRLIFNL